MKALDKVLELLKDYNELSLDNKTEVIKLIKQVQEEIISLEWELNTLHEAILEV